MVRRYEVDKWIWTDADFEQMGWHDSRIHAMAFLPDEFELVLDIDYIFQWVPPAPQDTYFRFWVAPATLVFENAHDLAFDLQSNGGELEIQDITREALRRPTNADYIKQNQEWQWIVACQQGEIRLRAVGYKQYIRATPHLGHAQVLDLRLRRGLSFARGRTSEDA